MTEQHTPGPWVYRADCENQTVRDANDLPVAFYVAKANGPIIATAPDTLNALREARLYVPDHHGHIAQRIDAAIAKAEGRA
jgi:hypothetical protein